MSFAGNGWPSGVPAAPSSEGHQCIPSKMCSHFTAQWEHPQPFCLLVTDPPPWNSAGLGTWSVKMGPEV